VHLSFSSGGPVTLITHLTRVDFVYNGPKGMELAPNHAIVEVAKALGGSFKSVTLAPKTKGDDSTAQGNSCQKNGDIQTNQKAQMNTQSTNLG